MNIFDLQAKLAAAAGPVVRELCSDLDPITSPGTEADGPGPGLPMRSGGPGPALAAAIPPVGITGGKVTSPPPGDVKWSIKVDWLTLVFPIEQREAAELLVNTHLGHGEELERGMNTYRRQLRWESGAYLAWSDDRPEFMLSINGDSCDLIPPAELLPFMRTAVEALGAWATRIDLAFDDYSRELLQLQVIHEAADRGDFCGFKVHNAHQEKLRTGELLGDAHYFGRRGKEGSGRQVVFYDKALESQGEINSVRMECRFAKEAAELVVQALASSFSVDTFNEKIRNAIGGAIDFRDRQGVHRHKDRMVRFDWWQRVLDVLGRAAIVVHHTPPPLQRSMEYFRDTWAGNLALVFELAESQGIDGDAYISSLVKLMVDQGKRKLDFGWRPGARALGLDFVSLLDGGQHDGHG